MGTTLSIDRINITTDELQRTVTTSTNLYFETLSYEKVTEIEKLISDEEENGVEIPYLNFETNEYEVYGETLSKITSKYGITLNGEDVEPTQLYRVEFSC